MRGAKRANRLFLIFSLLLLIVIGVKLSHVQDRDLEYYYRAKGSRRGAIRTAKENNQKVTFSQQRQGVQRSLWFDETNGLRRQFHLNATAAVVDLVMIRSDFQTQETFLRPHGWLQEKIGWEMPDGTEVEPYSDTFRFTKTKNLLSPILLREKVPFQVVRYYDAVKAVWDMQKDRLTLYKVNFTDYKKLDHACTFDISQAQLLLQGYAEEMVIHFKAAGKEEVSSTGLKLKVVQR